jgi:ATP/ADP translocase
VTATSVPLSPTPISQRITAFLKVKPGEERLIGLLVLLYFILALGFVFVQSMAFGIFLAEYGAQGLPYSYISIALLASVVAAFYIKLGGRVSFSKLLTINLTFLACVSLLVWLALNSPMYHITAFILPLWFQIVVNLGNLAVWTLASSLFDFQQGKRLFPVLSAGTWLANSIGGLFVPMLVRSIGTVHLLLLAALSFGTTLFILRIITRSYMQASSEKQRAQHAVDPDDQSTAFFKDRYVLLIFVYTVLWWVAFFFLDNIFSDRAIAQFSDADQLTTFIGQLLSLIGIVALISSTVITSRVITRFGLRVGLIAMPLFVILNLGILALSGSLGASLFFVFTLGAFAKLVNVAFGFSLSQSANAIVYQSLPDTVRRRVQTTAEGIVQPIATGIAGLSLLVLTAGLKFNYIGLAYVFVGLGMAWLIVIYLLSGNYVQALTRVITKRRLGDNINVLADPVSVALLRNRLHDAHAGIAIYALNKLEALDEKTVISELPNLIRHPAPEVRSEALLRIEKMKLRTTLKAVQNQYTVETDPSVKESALRALGVIAEEPSQLIQALSETDVYSLRGALIGLLKYGNNSAADRRLKILLESSSNVDRNLAIEILGEVGRREWIPFIINACDSPETSRAAALALTSIGSDALSEIESAFEESEAPRQRLSTLSKTLGHIGGVKAQNILLSRLATPDHELRSQILNALHQTGYRAQDISEIQRAVKAEVEQAAWVSATQIDLGETDETSLMNAALKELLAQIRNRILLLLSFVFDADSIQRVRETFMTGSGIHTSYALEIMDVQLSAEWKKMVMPLLEDLSLRERNRLLSVLFLQAKQSPEECLRAIIGNEHFSFWVRACAVHTSANFALPMREGDNVMLSTVEKVLILKTVPMFSQTPDNVLADVANLLEQVDVSENETIFREGDVGDDMYVILDGKVRVHNDERLVNDLGEREVFGEMALLDPEPRSASVTALEMTRLFRLNQGSFYKLMEERPEVAMGIIHILTARLRNVMRDNHRLDARLRELEGKGRA